MRWPLDSFSSPACKAYRAIRSAGAPFCFLLATSIIATGCASPQGVLFPSFDPPLVWPAPPDEPRARLIGILASSDDLHASQSAAETLAAMLRGARPAIKFSSPHGIAVSQSGIVAVTDSAGACLHLIDLEQRDHRLVIGSEDARFGVPIGVTWADDRLFMTDAQRKEVVELNTLGEVLNRFGSKDLSRPVGIAYSPTRDRLFVVDGGSHQIVSFNLSGAKLETYGHRGSGPGEFNYPTHICAGGERLLVADTGNFRVQLLDQDGQPLSSIGQKGDGAGDFSLPKGVALDQEGRVYVVDAHFENLQIFAPSGQLLMALGEEGTAPGFFALPAGLAIDSQNRIWIADSGNKRLQVFKLLKQTKRNGLDSSQRGAS